jgi:hypothetical protein
MMRRTAHADGDSSGALQHADELLVGDPVPLPRLRPDDLAVQLGQCHGDASRDQPGGHDARAGWVLVHRDDQRESDDGAVDDPGHLMGAQMSLEAGAHATGASSPAPARDLIRSG